MVLKSHACDHLINFVRHLTRWEMGPLTMAHVWWLHVLKHLGPLNSYSCLIGESYTFNVAVTSLSRTFHTCYPPPKSRLIKSSTAHCVQVSSIYNFRICTLRLICVTSAMAFRSVACGFILALGNFLIKCLL